jgi:hypothetical protein
VSFSPPLPRPLDRDPVDLIEPLKRSGTAKSGASIPLLIQRPQTVIRPKRYRRISDRHVANPSSNRFSFRFSNLFCFKTLKNHNFSSVTRKIANETSLESLECVESNGSIKPIILWDYFESIGRSESSP